jgi:hypothetical protein
MDVWATACRGGGPLTVVVPLRRTYTFGGRARPDHRERLGGAFVEAPGPSWSQRSPPEAQRGQDARAVQLEQSGDHA